MSQDAPLVLNIKGNSLDDGPGIRSVVFFKGCPLSCVWCHNPESKKAGVEIAFDKKACVDCGACRDYCPEGALSKAFSAYIDRQRCTLCFECVETCPAGALEQVGKPMAVAEIVSAIEPDIPFFQASGGGVTLSGGEATLFMDFVSELLMTLKSRDIHTLMETCGQFDLDRFMTLLYPHLDTIYYDIKILDTREHQKYCGLPNQRILANFKSLTRRAAQDGKELLPRIPLIPGFTDTEDNIRAIASFLKDLGVRKAALLDYNPLWHEKSEKIGAGHHVKDASGMTTFSEHGIVERSRTVFLDAGIEIIA